MKHNFRELNIWKLAMSIAQNTYILTSELPNNEKYSLISQINRASISIPSNIAEGSGRTTNKEFHHFLNISLSSSFELETQLILANSIYSLEITELINSLNELQRMIKGFQKTISI
jgi:four helix bundle protein